jgi:uncharacterized membrane protein
MKILMPIVSFLGLVLVFVPAVAYLADTMDKNTMTTIMLIGTVIWFVSAPFWMGRNASKERD